MISEKEDLIAKLQFERAFFESIVSIFAEEQIVGLEVSDHWTVKDIIAHITAWEIELLGWLETASRRLPLDILGPGEWAPYIETFNSSAFRENHDRPLGDVIQRSERVYKEVLAKLQSVPEDPEDDYWSVWFNGEPPWILFATYHEHYREHGVQINSWSVDTAQ
jgi:hypothetical protein